MKRRTFLGWTAAGLAMGLKPPTARSADNAAPMSLRWEKDYLTMSGDSIPGKEIVIHYLEAYCRAGSTDADWVKHTVVPHKTRLVEAGPQLVKLHCDVEDGLQVDHEIRSTHDEIDFR